MRRLFCNYRIRFWRLLDGGEVEGLIRVLVQCRRSLQQAADRAGPGSGPAVAGAAVSSPPAAADPAVPGPHPEAPGDDWEAAVRRQAVRSSSPSFLWHFPSASGVEVWDLGVSLARIPFFFATYPDLEQPDRPSAVQPAGLDAMVREGSVHMYATDRGPLVGRPMELYFWEKAMASAPLRRTMLRGRTPHAGPSALERFSSTWRAAIPEQDLARIPIGRRSVARFLGDWDRRLEQEWAPARRAECLEPLQISWADWARSGR